jgi:peptidoglycan-N-acetylglucosamine deacetylase
MAAPLRAGLAARSGGGSPARTGPKEAAYRRLVEIASQDDEERQRGIRTFFIVGEEAERYPEILQRMALDGHEVGNHTFHHYRLPRIPLEEVGPEITMTSDLIHSVIGAKSRLFRPPGGEYNAAIQRVIEHSGMVNVLWTNDPADYALGRTPEEIETFVMRDITPGGIILLHDGVKATYAALPRFVARIRARGYIFVTVSELIARGGGLLKTRNNRISRTSAE